MNRFMIRKLVVKDWYFHRGIILTYLLAGLISLSLLFFAQSDALFYLGSILLFTVLIALGIHLAMSTVINERKEKTLPFILSLPITIQEYTSGKIVANMLIFLVPWFCLLSGTVFVVATKPGLPLGLIPFVVLLLGEILLGYCLILALALVSESEGWTIFGIVLTNIGFNLFLYYLFNASPMAGTAKNETLIIPPFAWLLAMAEGLAAVVLLGLTYRIQAQKTHFL
ncbi:MAG: hypothetical protein H6510_00765 [Acidobacteria bacterium]|nr:hypothetical protein [Acidobacteriota bacterium]MCB9396319.1 hypothetical protein [Acidobacteriota bacterium]